MRRNEFSYIEYVDLIDIGNPISNTTRLKQLRPVFTGNMSGNKADIIRRVSLENINNKQKFAQDDLGEVIYRMIG